MPGWKVVKQLAVVSMSHNFFLYLITKCWIESVLGKRKANENYQELRIINYKETLTLNIF